MIGSGIHRGRIGIKVFRNIWALRYPQRQNCDTNPLIASFSATGSFSSLGREQAVAIDCERIVEFFASAVNNPNKMRNRLRDGCGYELAACAGAEAKVVPLGEFLPFTFGRPKSGVYGIEGLGAT